MRIKDTGIYQIYRKCFSSDKLRIWRSQMENAYKRYLKAGLTAEQSLARLEKMYVGILMDVAANHPRLFRSKEIHETVVNWMHSPNSVIPALPSKNEKEENN